MDNKYKLLFIAEDEVDDLGAIINCAVRYCLSRESYMPGLVRSFICKHAELLNKKTVDVMIRDITQATEGYEEGIGSKDIRTMTTRDYQAVEWINFKEWLERKGAEMMQD